MCFLRGDNVILWLKLHGQECLMFTTICILLLTIFRVPSPFLVQAVRMQRLHPSYLHPKVI